MTAAVAAQTPSSLLEQKELPAFEQDRDPMTRRETLELVRAHSRIPDAAIRKKVFDLTKMIAMSDPAP